MTEIRLSPVGRIWVSLGGPAPRVWRTPGAVRGLVDEQVADFTLAVVLTEDDGKELARALHQAQHDIPHPDIFGPAYAFAISESGQRVLVDEARSAIRRLIAARAAREAKLAGGED